MAKFCTNCGKSLNENEICECQKNKDITGKQDPKDHFNSFIELVKGMFQKPIETMKNNYKQSNLILTNIMIAGGSVILGIFLMLFLKETVGGLFNLISFVNADYSFPYFRIFLTSTLMGVVTYYLITLILQIFIKYIFKKDVEYKYILNIVATISIYITLAALLSIVLVFISLYIVYALLLVASILVIISLTFALKEIIELDDMKVIYTVVVASLMVIIINWVAMPRLFM